MSVMASDKVTIIVDNIQGKMVETLPFEHAVAISQECSFKVQGSEFMYRSKSKGKSKGKGNWDGFKRLYHSGRRTFPTGLLGRIVWLLHDRGIQADIEWCLPNVACGCPIPLMPHVESRSYQIEAEEAAIKAGRCIIRVATGGGKTVIAARIIAKLGMSTMFMVHTKDLLYQAKDMLGDFLGQEIGQIGDGVVAPARITVATIQTVSRILNQKYEHYEYEDILYEDNTDITGREQVLRDLIENTGVLFMDECHRVASKTATEVMSAIKNARYRFGLSASPWRDDGADLALEAIFGHVAYEVSASNLIDRGYLVRPVIRMIEISAIKTKKGDKWQEVYKRAIVENEYRNNIVVVEAIKLLKSNRSVLILVKYIGHGDILYRMLRDSDIHCVFLSGGDSSLVRNNVINQLRNKSLQVVIATTIADEGLDIKSLDAVILAGGGKSSVKALQRVGRALRPFDGKDLAYIIDFEDRSKYVSDHSMARYRIYQTETEFIIMDI